MVSVPIGPGSGDPIRLLPPYTHKTKCTWEFLFIRLETFSDAPVTIEIVGIPKMTRSRRSIYSFCWSKTITMSDNLIINLTVLKYLCKLDNYIMYRY